MFGETNTGRNVKFYAETEDFRLKYAVIISKYRDQWVFCRHKERATWECPGGHREAGEEIDQTAHRELWEETGAEEFTLQKVCVYSVGKGTEETFGMLYYANIFKLGKLPDLEMERIEFFDDLPDRLTYPFIQPDLFRKVQALFPVS